MQDSQWTNAGLGSNLTLDGTVECDASIMDGQSLHYGAVGAVSGCVSFYFSVIISVRTEVSGGSVVYRTAFHPSQSDLVPTKSDGIRKGIP